MSTLFLDLGLFLRLSLFLPGLGRQGHKFVVCSHQTFVRHVDLPLGSASCWLRDLGQIIEAFEPKFLFP